ncbi:hypothetical protein ACS0TY_035862 [Phlomoides rotata]
MNFVNLSKVNNRAQIPLETFQSASNNIDLSNNNLSGDIPEELTSLVELRSLNLSQNRLTGSIPDKIGDMKQLESLDFSRNSLSGRIPDGFALLSFLSYLNLSYNKLTGEIPKSAQLQSIDASSFVGNSLCGSPLTDNCSGELVMGTKMIRMKMMNQRESGFMSSYLWDMQWGFQLCVVRWC